MGLTIPPILIWGPIAIITIWGLQKILKAYFRKKNWITNNEPIKGTDKYMPRWKFE